MTIRLMIISLFLLTSLQGIAQEFRFPTVDTISGIKMWHFPCTGTGCSIKGLEPSLIRHRYKPFISLDPGADNLSAKERLSELLRLEDFYPTYTFNPTTEETDFLVDLYLRDGRVVSFSSNEDGDLVSTDGRFVSPFAAEVLANLDGMMPEKLPKARYTFETPVEDKDHPANFARQAENIEIYYVQPGSRSRFLYDRYFQGLRLNVHQQNFFKSRFYRWLELDTYQKNEEETGFLKPQVVIHFTYRDGTNRYLLSQDFRTFLTRDKKFKVTYPPETTQFFKDLLGADT